MNQNRVRTCLDRFLSRTLSGSVFSWQEILNLIIPGVLDAMSITFIGVLITALISKNGETSVAATSLVGPINNLVVCLFSGISSGGTVIVAQCCGKRDSGLLQKSIGMTLWLTVGIGAAVCLPFLLMPGSILRLLYPDAQPEVMAKACAFLTGSAWSNLIFTVYTACFAILRGLGESRRCLVLSIIINAAYLVFSILFLNILHLDIKGSAAALILARFLGAAASVVLLLVWHPPVRLRPREIFVYDRSVLRETLHISIPLGMEQICSSLGAIVAQMYMIHLGTTAIATQAITNSLLSLLYAPASAACALTVTVVGRCIGARKYEEAYRYGRRCNQIALILLAATAVIVFPLLPVLLKQYNPSPEAYASARKILYATLPALMLFWPSSNTLPNTLRAASDTVYPTVLSLCVLWLVTIALGYFLSIPAGLGLWGVWIATWISWAIRDVGFFIRFHGRKWLYKSSLKLS